jgi:hypothetical protein
LLKDLRTLVRLGLMSRAHLAAENLVLRKQVALYQDLDRMFKETPARLVDLPMECK